MLKQCYDLEANSNLTLKKSPARDDRTIRRVIHKKGFVPISNSTVQDQSLSWEARGLLVYLLSLHENWEIRVSHLQGQGNAGRDGIRRMLKELQTHGYASGFGKPDVHTNSGHFGSVGITIYESPADNPTFNTAKSPTPEKPSSATPTTVEPTPEKPSLYKRQIVQKTEFKKDTHTARSATPATPRESANAGVSVPIAKSRFSQEQVRAWTDAQKAGGANINPYAAAHARWLDGTADDDVEKFLVDCTPAAVEAKRSAPADNRMREGEARNYIRAIRDMNASHNLASAIEQLHDTGKIDETLRYKLLKEFSPSLAGLRDGGAIQEVSA